MEKQVRRKSCKRNIVLVTIDVGDIIDLITTRSMDDLVKGFEVTASVPVTVKVPATDMRYFEG